MWNPFVETKRGGQTQMCITFLRSNLLMTVCFFEDQQMGYLPSHWVEWFDPFCRRFAKAPAAHLYLKPCSRQGKSWTPPSWTFYSFKLRLRTTWKHKARSVTFRSHWNAMRFASSVNTATMNDTTSAHHFQNKTLVDEYSGGHFFKEYKTNQWKYSYTVFEETVVLNEKRKSHTPDIPQH